MKALQERRDDTESVMEEESKTLRGDDTEKAGGRIPN